MDFENAKKNFSKNNQDVYIYVGAIDQNIDLLRQMICQRKNKKGEVTFFLSTLGGDPDWAYRLVVTFRMFYSKINMVIPGLCKSAGTLIALGADTLRFHEFGELGPLDVQMKRKDNLIGANSGLDVFQSLQIINSAAKDCFTGFFLEFLLRCGGGISTELVAKTAKDIAIGIYSSIASKIDPLELGEKNRAMNIAKKYGEVLNLLSKQKNLKQGTLEKFITDYPSHTFAIDKSQADSLFNYVEKMTEDDYAIYNQFEGNFRSLNPFLIDLSFTPLEGDIRHETEKEDQTDHKEESSIVQSTSAGKTSKRKK